MEPKNRSNILEKGLVLLAMEKEVNEENADDFPESDFKRRVADKNS
jgi:hypothetical protein